jgi:putative endonuclease
MNKNRSRHRQQAQKSGRYAEAIAALYLRLKAYRVIARNFRHNVGEIDIIAVRGSVIVFVEVKHRAGGRVGLEAVTPRQWQRIGAAAGAFVGRHQSLHKMSWRFDFIGVGRFGWPYHLRDVWRF